MTRRPSPSWIPDEIMKQLMPVLSKQILDELMIYIVKHTEALGKYSGELAETVEDVKPRVRNLYRMKMESKDVMEEDSLRRLLEKAQSFADYEALLLKNGYTVYPVADGQ